MQKCEMREQPLESSETEYSANVGMLYFVCECTQHLLTQYILINRQSMPQTLLLRFQYFYFHRMATWKGYYQTRNYCLWNTGTIQQLELAWWCQLSDTQLTRQQQFL